MNKEVGSNPTEPRRGIAPFDPSDNGIEKENVAGYEFIISKPFQFGSLGKASVVLNRPLEERTILRDTSEDDQAFTIGISGEINRGKLYEFQRAGYYMVEIDIEPYNLPIDEAAQEIMNVNAWIGNNEATVTADLKVDPDDIARAFFAGPTDAKGTWEEFVLPNNPKILQALRINVSSN